MQFLSGLILLDKSLQKQVYCKIHSTMIEKYLLFKIKVYPRNLKKKSSKLEHHICKTDEVILMQMKAFISSPPKGQSQKNVQN